MASSCGAFRRPECFPLGHTPGCCSTTRMSVASWRAVRFATSRAAGGIRSYATSSAQSPTAAPAVSPAASQPTEPLPALPVFLRSVDRLAAAQRGQDAMLRRAAAGALPWTRKGSREHEAAATFRLEEAEDLPAHQLRRLLGLDTTPAALTEAVTAGTKSEIAARVSEQLSWERTVRSASLGLGTSPGTVDTSDAQVFNASLPLETEAAVWLDSTRRKRKSKMRKHKHRKLLKKMRAVKIKQGRV